jgi:hypothetical protein
MLVVCFGLVQQLPAISLFSMGFPQFSCYLSPKPSQFKLFLNAGFYEKHAKFCVPRKTRQILRVFCLKSGTLLFS